MLTPSPVLQWETAYRVPWRVDRSRAPSYSLWNRGNERLHGIHLILLGEGNLIWGLPSVIEPEDSVEFILRADEPEQSSIVCVRWFRPNEQEYLWRISF